MEATRRCPYCDEEIRAEAIRCRHCRSRLAAFDPGAWYRDLPERRVAGVASAVAHALAIPVAAARLAFIVLTVFHLAGFVTYLALWLVVPFRPGDEPPFARAVSVARNVAAELKSAFHRPRPPHDPASRPQSGSGDVPATGVPC